MTSKANVNVCLTDEIRLEKALKEAGVENPATIVKLTVSGNFTDDDFRFIRENMAETLQVLDLGDVSTVKRIGEGDFYGCSGLTSITIPKSVVDIEIYSGNDDFGWAFEECWKLETITVHPNNPVFASEDGVLFSKNRSKLILCPKGKQGDYIIPSSVIEIGECAFCACYKLTSISIPNSVTKIGADAFFGCTGLVSLDIPALVTTIGKNALNVVSDLKTISLPGKFFEKMYRGQILCEDDFDCSKL